MQQEYYIPLNIELLSICGIHESMCAMRLPKKNSEQHTDTVDEKIGERDKKLAQNLIKAGDDHAKFLRGVECYFRLKMQAGWMIEFDTYRIGVDTLSTSSTMHNELKGMKGVELAREKQGLLPYVVYERISKANYQSLRRIYKQRKGHRHPDWKIFLQFIETLPYSNELILV